MHLSWERRFKKRFFGFLFVLNIESQIFPFLHQVLLSHYRDFTTKRALAVGIRSSNLQLARLPHPLTRVLRRYRRKQTKPAEIYFARLHESEEDESRELSGQKALWMAWGKHYNEFIKVTSPLRDTTLWIIATSLLEGPIFIYLPPLHFLLTF